MHLPLCVLLYSFLVSSTFIAIAGENVNSKKTASKKEENLNLFIDDEDMEVQGSGNGEGRYDLESSGSGGGSDDDEIDTKGEGNTETKSVDTKEKEPTLPMPSPKPSSPTSLPPQNPEPPIGDTFSKTSTIRPTDKKISDDNEHTDRGTDKIDKTAVEDSNRNENGVRMVNNHDRDRTTSFFAQPGILAAVIGGAVVGLLCAILVVMFIVYRMRKKDEGSYALEDMKRSPATNPYMKPNHREFFA